jgi:hypothetical protein
MPPPNRSGRQGFKRVEIQNQYPPTYISGWNGVGEVQHPLERETHWGYPKSVSLCAEMRRHDWDVWVAF